MMFYFWVTWIDANGVETPIFADPASIESKLSFRENPLTPTSTFPSTGQINQSMAFIFEEIRRRHLFMLENDGEVAEVYLRRWSATPPFGTPCSCVDGDPTDSGFNGNAKCAECFGTGIRGGYYPKISIKFRYSEMPPRTFKFKDFGIELGHSFTSWTIWAPKLREHDLLVRVKTGERFLITETKSSEWRGLVLHQSFNLKAIPQTDIVQMVSNETIAKAIELDQTASFQKQGWKVFN
jgi:hypothetical protein